MKQGPTQADRDRANDLVRPVVAAFEKFAAEASWHWFWACVAVCALLQAFQRELECDSGWTGPAPDAAATVAELEGRAL
jgi:hypothetical protein